MPRGTTLRNVRVADDLWRAAQEAAARRGESVSEAIRDLLEAYVATPDVVLESLRTAADERPGDSFPSVVERALGVYEMRHGSRGLTQHLRSPEAG